MTLTPLITIYLSPRQDVGFTVPANHDAIIKQCREEILATLVRLTNALREGRYPFKLESPALRNEKMAQSAGIEGYDE